MRNITKLFFLLFVCTLIFALASCDESKETQPHVHVFDSWQVESQATCTQEGSMLRTCEECGTEERRTVEKLAHDLSKAVTPPTCEDEGYTLYSCECGYSAKLEQVAPLGHTLSAAVTAPTCDLQGYTVYTCECGYSIETDYVKPLGHTLEKEITPPTCTQQGYTHYECEVCEYEFDGDFIKPLEHRNSSATRFYPTVTSSGYTLYECEDCGHSYKQDYISYKEIVPSAYTSNKTVLQKGIDTSMWNHPTGATSSDLLPIDWEALKEAGVEFVILRAGTTSEKDPAFEEDYAAAKAAGLQVGAYFYTYSASVSDTVTDAHKMLEWIEGKQFEYPIYFDIEDPSLESLDKQRLTDICFAFTEVLQENGYFCGIYLNDNWLNHLLDTEIILSSFDIWYARYPLDVETPWGTDQYAWSESYGEQLSMWQYTQKGKIGEVFGEFDFNYSYKNYREIMIKWGLNGF